MWVVNSRLFNKIVILPFSEKLHFSYFSFYLLIFTLICIIQFSMYTNVPLDHLASPLLLQELLNLLSFKTLSLRTRVLMVGLSGLEPPTSRLSGVRSSLLSYKPICQCRFRCPSYSLWWRWGESNSWPPACKAGALPAELHPHRCLFSCLFEVNPQN